MSGPGGLAGAPANKRARTVEPEPMPEMQLPPSPASPDVGEPSLPGAGAPAACKSHELPPMFVGMQPCYKPSHVDIAKLRRQSNKSAKTKYRGLPPKTTLAVTMIRKYVRSRANMLSRQERDEIDAKLGWGEKVGPWVWPASKWIMWTILSIEANAAEVFSTSTGHMALATRRNVAAFKVAVEESTDAKGEPMAASSMKGICAGVAHYLDTALGLCSPPCSAEVAAEVQRSCELLRGAGGRYSKFAKKKGREYKREEELEANWLGKKFAFAQQKHAFMAALQRAKELLGKYEGVGHATVPLLQHPAANIREAQQLLVTCVSLAMMVPREPIIMAFKMQWVVGGGGAYSINPGINSEDFKNLSWRGGSIPIRAELAKALKLYMYLTWPCCTPSFEESRDAGGNLISRGGKGAAIDAAAALLPAVRDTSSFHRIRNHSPLFFEGVPDSIDAIAMQHGDSSPAALQALSAILVERLKSLQAKRGISMHALRYTFVQWLGTYDDYDHNTGRHVASWTAYLEWYNQIKFDIQGLPSPYVGKTYDEHAAHASAIMGHDVDIHEQTYLPVSPSHQTREQELAAAACAEPLDAVAAAAAAATGPGSDNDEYDEY